MSRNIVFMLFLIISMPTMAGVTLQCEANRKCDAYLKNCTNAPYSFSVFIDPQNNSVTMGSSKIQADFGNPAEVSFKHIGYTFYINKHEYSAILANKTETRNGWCKKVDPAW